MRFSSLFLAALISGSMLGPGCGLTLDYDPPTDGGMDAPGPDVPPPDAAVPDAPPVGCRTDLDCANGNACDGEERCVDRVCTAGSPIHCGDDEDVCDGSASCDPATGLCVATPAETCEDDGDPCNGEERCDPVLGCSAGPVPDCDDGIDCTVDACMPRVGCVNTPDDTLCDPAAGSVCTPFGCSEPACEDDGDCISDDACFVGVCNDGECAFEAFVCPATLECCAGICVPMGCDDANPCTDDRCGRRMGCVNTPRVGSCSDDNRCTLNDVCVAGACTGGPRRPCLGTDVGMCEAGMCDDASGECITVPLSGTPCVDSNYCTLDDRCVNGTCTSGSTAPDCDDGEFCTADSCDTNTGCQFIALRDGTECPGIVPSTCMSGRCVGAITTDCPVGTFDCDDDGRCECGAPCAARLCADIDAACHSTGCGSSERCCDTVGAFEFGTCVPSTCATCCTIR